MNVENKQHCNSLEKALTFAKRAHKDCVYAIGCVITDFKGNVISCGFTGELQYSDSLNTSLPHAEEIALKKLLDSGAKTPADAILYSTMEPCSERKSGRESCTDKIIKSGIKFVVFGCNEPYDPKLDIHCQGASKLKEAGITVLQLTDYAGRALLLAQSRETTQK